MTSVPTRCSASGPGLVAGGASERCQRWRVASASASQLEMGAVTVVPVTSSIRRVYPFQVLLPARASGLRHDSEAQAEQVRSMAVQRLGPRVGSVPPAMVEKLDEALRLRLAV